MFAAAQVELDHAPAAGALIDLFLLRGPVFTGETGRFGPLLIFTYKLMTSLGVSVINVGAALQLMEEPTGDWASSPRMRHSQQHLSSSTVRINEIGC